MKQKADKADPWIRSTLVNRAEPAGAGLKPWAKLTEKQKTKFAAAFLDDCAWSSRVKAFKRTQGDRHSLAAILHAYQAELRKDEGQSSTAIRCYASMLEEHLMFMLNTGDWKGFKWLADYGEKHCKTHVTKHKVPTWFRPSGEKEMRHFGLVSGKGTFPAPNERLKDPEETGWIIAARILRVFAHLAGMNEDAIVRKPALETPPPEWDGTYSGLLKRVTHKSKPTLGTMTPKRLPTKGYLFEKVKELRKDDAKISKHFSTDAEISKHFSTICTKLGLGGLPDSRGGDMRMK